MHPRSLQGKEKTCPDEVKQPAEAALPAQMRFPSVGGLEAVTALHSGQGPAYYLGSKARPEFRNRL